MADGFYRFQQSGAGQYFHQQQNPRAVGRTASPPLARRPFNNDTPSPSRSPVNRSAGHSAFNMYSHGGHQGHNMMMNGGQHHQRFGMQMPKQNQSHHPQHQQGHHQNQHNQGPHLGHQYTYSGGLSAGTPHFTQSHLQNGSSEPVHDDADDDMGEHWQQQRAIGEECRRATSPHFWARHIARDQKGLNFSGNSGVEESRLEVRNRAVNGSTSKRQDWMAIDFGGQGLRSLSTALFKYSFLEKLYLNHNQLTELPPEIGSLKKLALLDVTGNRLTALPAEIGMLINLEKLLAFDNNIKTLPYELGYLWRLELFGVHGNPLEDHLKDKIREGGTKALVAYLRENKPYDERPCQREWVSIDETASPDQVPDKVTAVTYNILCDWYATKQQYPYVSEKILDWERRKRTILSELRRYDADIVCLQELDRWNYDEFFRGELSYNGYKGYFAQKSRADTMGDQAKFVDGCGTFWKEKKYICLDQQHIVYGRKAVDRPGAKASADMLNRVWGRDDIATVVFLENRITGSRLMVANTHTYWDPMYKDVKLIQVAVLMEELTKLGEKYSKMPPCTNKQVFRFSDAEESDTEPATPGPSLSYSDSSQIPLIICGDFNAGFDSAVYELITQGGLARQHTDLVDRNYGSFSTEGTKHPFTMRSAYNGEMRFTNYTPGFVDVLDHIWYSSNSLRVQKILLGVDETYIRTLPGFPSEQYPSDHIALKAEFMVASKKKGPIVEANFGGGSSSRDRDRDR